MRTRSLRQTVTFAASPQTVYGLLMTSKLHAAFTGEPTTISTKVGGTVTAYGDYISGRNLALLPGKKIVQTWRASNWPEGHFSTVTFAFAKTAKGTRLTFTHSGIPADDFANIREGWKEYYWQPIRGWLAAQRQ